jgi:hypothetical protein
VEFGGELLDGRAPLKRDFYQFFDGTGRLAQ